MKESELQRQIIDYLKRIGAYVLNVYGSGMTGKGTPDILACYQGLFIAVETKVGKNRMSPAQKIIRQRILTAGGIHIVPYSLEQFISEFKEAVIKE